MEPAARVGVIACLKAIASIALGRALKILGELSSLLGDGPVQEDIDQDDNPIPIQSPLTAESRAMLVRPVPKKAEPEPTELAGSAAERYRAARRMN